MINLTYSGNLNKVITAVTKANEILANPNFYNAIRNHTTFDNTNYTGNQIANLMQNATHTILVLDQLMPIANAKTKNYYQIRVSRKNFSNVLNVAVNTLIHETVHAIDWLDGHQDFTHDGNGPVGQQNTAPWVIGQIAEDMV